MKGHARDLMSTTVKRATPETTLDQLAGLLVAGEFGGLPVVGSGDDVVGFVSETDVMVALLEGKAPETPARGIMTSPAEVVDEFTTTDDVMTLLRTRGVHHLPVVRAGKLVGIISPIDVLRYFVEKVAPRPRDAG